MAKYTGPVCRICRTEGTKLFLKGDRCNTNKCSISRRNYRAGQHGQNRQKVSEYGLRLREKQKLRKTYGVLEGQFRRYYEMAAQQKGVTGEHLLQLLETRLDNMIYRMGFASSRAQARQIVRHNHILVNGKRVNIPSFHVKPGQTVSICEKSRDAIRNLMGDRRPVLFPTWLNVDFDNLSASLLNMPGREEIDTPVKENLVIEYYAR